MKIKSYLQSIAVTGVLCFSLIVFRFLGISQCTDTADVLGRVWVNNDHIEILWDGTKVVVAEEDCVTIHTTAQDC